MAMLQDSVEESHHATFNGDASIVAITGHPLGFAYALDLDGTGDYLDAGNVASANFGTGDFSVEAWVKRGVTGVVTRLLGTYSTVMNAGWAVVIRNTDAIRFSTRGVKDYDWAGATITDTDWHHIVVAMDSDYDCILFLDGISQGEVAYDVAPTQSTSSFEIGSTEGGTTPLTGQLAAVHLWNVALSADDVSALYAGSVGSYRDDVALIVDLPDLVDISGNITGLTGSGMTVGGPGINGGNTGSFDGTDDYIDCGDADDVVVDPNLDITLICWLKPDFDYTENAARGIAGVNVLYGVPSWSLTKMNNAASNVLMYTALRDAANFEIYLTTNPATFLRKGTWICLVFVRRDDIAQFYVDAEPIATDVLSQTGDADGINFGAHTFQIGRDGANGSADWLGEHDQWTVYNTAMSRIQINEAFHQSRRGLY
jgi:hypothetical protein